jgi:hypothetical protein
VRDRYFCEAMWYSRRRAEELKAVRIRDVDLKPYADAVNGVLTWTNSKAHRPGQHLNMSLPLHRTIAEWLAIYGELAGEAPKPGWYLFPGLALEGLTIRDHRRRLVLAPERPIGQPDKIAREAFRRAGIWQEGMATHAFRRGSATDLYEQAIVQGHKHPLRIVMTALDHSDEKMTENYLDKSRDTRDLTELEQQIYGGGEEAQQAIEQPAPASTVVSWPTGPSAIRAESGTQRARRDCKPKTHLRISADTQRVGAHARTRPWDTRRGHITARAGGRAGKRACWFHTLSADLRIRSERRAGRGQGFYNREEVNPGHDHG